MSIRLIVTLSAKPGKGSELAKAYGSRCPEVQREAGCEQFEVFQSVIDSDKLVLLECWRDQAALDAHGKLNATRAPLAPELRGSGATEREDYEYNKTR